LKRTKGIFDRSKFKVTRDISPTISGWLLVDTVTVGLRHILLLELNRKIASNDLSISSKLVRIFTHINVFV